MSSDLTARARELRAELASLDTADHPLAQEQRRQDLLGAYHRERAGVEARLAQARQRGEQREVVRDLAAPGGMKLGKSGNERALELLEQLAAIDAEIARLAGASE